MKKLLLLLLLTLPALGQSFSGRSAGDIFIVPPYHFCLGEDNGKNVCFVQNGANAAQVAGQLDFQLTSKTVATLPSASANKGRMYQVTDGTSSSDCSVGSGSTVVICASNGASWATLGGAGTGNVSTTPAGNQAIVQPVSSGATTQFSTNNDANVRKVTASWNWSNTPGGSYTGGSPATLSLGSCPAGVSGNDANLWLYISGGTGTAEAVQSAGTGSGTPGTACTINFTPVNSHSGAFTVSSASTGIYEALKDATAANVNNATIKLSPTNPPNTNYYAIYAPVTITGANIEIDGGQSAMVDCEAWQQACFVATAVNGPIHIHGFRTGTKSTQNIFHGVDAAITNTACAANACTITTTFNPPVGSSVVIAGTFDPFFWGPVKVASTSGSQFTYTCTGCSKASQASAGGVSYEFALVDTTAIGTHVDHISVDAPSGFQGATMNNLFVVRNDQDFHLSDVTINSALGGCDANACANGFYAPGPFSPNAAVVYIDHYNVSLNCNGNGITDYAGNTLHVSDTIIQGFNQWAVATGVLRGGFGPSQFDNVYTEVGSCTNPLYPGSGTQAQAQAGLLEYGGRASVRDGEFPVGQLPQFANTGNGGTRYNYFLVVHDSLLGQSIPLYCGYASVDSVTPTGSITVVCPRVQGTNTVTYDLLRSAGAISGGGSGVWPVPGFGNCPGGSTSACGSILTAQPQQSTTMLTFTDTASASTTAYTIQQSNYYPFVPFLPGAAILLTTADSQSVINVASLQSNNLFFTTSVSTIFAEQNQVPSVVADMCSLFQAGIFAVCASGNSNGNSNGNVVGELMQAWPATGGGFSGAKGRINFPVVTGGDIQATELITLVDSNTPKTLSTPNLRPTWDANDTYIGLDQPTSSNGPATAGMSLGAPVSISEYIANTGDNASWVTRTLAGSFAIQGHLNQQATKQFAGSCAMVAGTSCTFTLTAAYSSTPMCVVSPITTTSGSVVAGACSVSGTTVTITAAGSNSLTWNAILVGNPN